MDTQNLAAFLQVATTGSFSLAAEKLHLTQPAVSKRVAQLEARLEAQLFDRIGRHVSVTEAGAALLPHARAVQRDLLAAEQSVRDLAGEVAGRLKLATSHHIGLHRLPPVLRHFSTQYPGVQLDIDFMDSEQAYDQTLRGEIELAVVTLAPETLPHIVAREVWPDPLDFMVQPGHPLTRYTSLDIALLSPVPAVLPGLNTYTGQIVERTFAQRGVPLAVAMTTNYLETIRMMASVGLGWTILPRSMADASLATLPVTGARLQRSLGVIYHEGRSLSRAARAFMQSLGLFGERAADAS